MEDNSLSSVAGVDVQTVLKDYDYTVGVFFVHVYFSHV